MLVCEICNSPVIMISARASLEQASTLMFLKNVGSLVVVDEIERPTGIVTDRDLAIKGIPLLASGNEVSVQEVMSKHPMSIQPDISVEEAMLLMEQRGIRRVLVINEEEKVIGLLSADDCLQELICQMKSLAEIYHSKVRQERTPIGQESSKMA